LRAEGLNNFEPERLAIQAIRFFSLVGIVSARGKTLGGDFATEIFLSLSDETDHLSCEHTLLVPIERCAYDADK